MKFFIALFFAAVTTSALAASRSSDRTWLGLMGKKPLANPEFAIWSEVQSRLDNDKFVDQQLLFRWGLLKKVSESVEAGFIYGYIITGITKEHRPGFQVAQNILRNAEHSFSIRHRLEYRKREDQEAISGRYRATVRYQKNFNARYSLIVWDEPFMNLTREDWTGRRAIERNRLFLGTGLSGDGVNFELGYMHQYTPRTARDIHDHIFVLTVLY